VETYVASKVSRDKPHSGGVCGGGGMAEAQREQPGLSYATAGGTSPGRAADCVMRAGAGCVVSTVE